MVESRRRTKPSWPPEPLEADFRPVDERPGTKYRGHFKEPSRPPVAPETENPTDSGYWETLRSRLRD